MLVTSMKRKPKCSNFYSTSGFFRPPEQKTMTWMLIWSSVASTKRKSAPSISSSCGGLTASWSQRRKRIWESTIFWWTKSMTWGCWLWQNKCRGNWAKVKLSWVFFAAWTKYIPLCWTISPKTVKDSSKHDLIQSRRKTAHSLGNINPG